MEPNSTLINATDHEIEEGGVTNAMKIAWIFGITFSTLSILLQIFLYVVVASSRKLDQKILTQMTVARYLNVVLEYLVFVGHSSKTGRFILMTLYIQMDAALICWMFVFTKNLYDKVVVVFTRKINLLVVSICIWVLSLPVGIICPLLLDLGYFDEFYLAYGVIKFIILSLNLLFFCKIFWIAYRRKSEGQLKRFIRTCISAFLLVCITSLQVFIGDLMSFISDYFVDPNVPFIFGIINSYEAIAMTILFVILVDGSTDDSLMENIKKRFKNNSVI